MSSCWHGKIRGRQIGRIHSIFMYPLTFDEFLIATHEEGLVAMREEAPPAAYGDARLRSRRGYLRG